MSLKYYSELIRIQESLQELHDQLYLISEHLKDDAFWEEEEIKKFTQGFAYVRPRSAPSGKKPKVHGLERKGNGGKHKKDSNSLRKRSSGSKKQGSRI